MTSTAPDNTNRFSGRIESYAQHRQGYPPEALSLASKHFNFPEDASLLDLGSGTGILTLQLLTQFPTSHVTAVEPNTDMRTYSLSAAPLRSFREQGRLTTLAGTAEATTLLPSSIDAIFAAAAFHWFDGPPARKEILRIGKKSANADGNSGVPLIILTGGRVSTTKFDEPGANDPRFGPDGYWRGFNERMQQFHREEGIDYTARVQDQKFSKEYLDEFFGHGEWKVVRSDSSRTLGLEEIIMGLESYSSNPLKGTSAYDKLVRGVTEIFEEWQRDGKVKFVRDRVMYYGYVR